MKKRIGLILASIHTGSALNLWTTLADEAERAGTAFFVFPGGRLDSRPDSEYLRNPIYRLANPENLDGLISWGSSIGGAVSLEELNHFHESLEPLPYVTIAHKMAGHPCIGFDAYTGFRSLVKHFIEVHGARKIAFLRGPENHASAEDRLRAFRDACLGAGLPDVSGNPLVSSPFPWSAGESAVVELCETRKLVPGKDFDTLIGSSDMMVFSAVRWLQKQGFAVPRDFRVGGFNDSSESRILSSPFSTVHMPYTELGLVSFRMIREQILKHPVDSADSPESSGNRQAGRKDDRSADRTLDAGVVIRESCGCRQMPSGSAGVSPSAPADGNGRDLRCRMTPLKLVHLLAGHFRLDETGVNAVLEPIVTAAMARNTGLFFNLLERALVRYFEDDKDSGLLTDAFSLSRDSAVFDDAWFEQVKTTFFLTLFKVQGRVLAMKTYETAKRYFTLNSLKCDLLGARDRESLITVLAHHLPQTGMHTAAIVLWENDGTSRFIGGFSPRGVISSPEASDSVFPERHLLPSKIIDDYGTGAFMVQPLFMENRPLGYFICNIPFRDGPVLDELRSAISSALKGIFLFEETSLAKQAAETAERAKSEFFANAGNDLLEPLQGIGSTLDELAGYVSAGGTVDSQALSLRLAGLRDRVLSQHERSSRLIDLTLSGIDGLSFETRLFRSEEILAGSGDHPLLQGDPSRLAEAIDLVTELFPDSFSLEEKPDGLRFCFRRSGAELASSNSLVLAERIVRLHYGDFRVEGSSCLIFLPWPNLAGLPPVRSLSANHILLLPVSDGGPGPVSSPGEFGLPSSPLPETVDRWQDAAGDTARAAETVLLSWKPDSASMDDWMRVNELRHHPNLFRSPVMCRSASISARTLDEAISLKVRKMGSAPILFVGTRRDRFPGWAEEGNVVSINSMEDFSSFVSRMVPSLVVFGSIDVQAVHTVRHDPATVLVPVLVLPDRVLPEDDIASLGVIPRVVLCNRGVASSPEFASRVRAIAAGEEMIPPHTGLLVKKAILYLNIHATSQIARWKLADSVNVSEDYLTRIFHRETGFSLWEYLNRYRVFLATELLFHTNDTIYEVALKTGFQDQAYFCRVFKKIHGIPPGKMRNQT